MSAAKAAAERAPIVEYRDGLEALKPVLEAEARVNRGQWARRRLASGTVVSMRLSAARADWRLAIARDVAPSTLVEKSRFEAEIQQIRAAMGSWRRGDDVYSAEGSIAAVFAPR